ncbi:MAG: hypothetical protein PHT95_02840 [Candidatus Omnitrophica bacterium]|nr:hypothetical protein [Candidatus Omnitrophota bacterium]MDD4013850.1 hypothetical protein [Candidatus Omnitrophota bacterium]
MKDLINKTLEEWFPGGEVSAGEVFLRVRDITYALAPGMYDPELGPGRMLDVQKGFCVPKHYLLGGILTELGYGVRYEVSAFKWADSLIDPSIAAASSKLPTTYHLSLKALISGEWRRVDATWDKGLIGSGLPVNASWDGLSDTIPAVKAIGERLFGDQRECDGYLKKKLDSYKPAERAALSRFSVKLNKWLSESREALAQGSMV